MSSVEAKKIVVHEPALGPGWHETIGLLIENMDPDACFHGVVHSDVHDSIVVGGDLDVSFEKGAEGVRRGSGPAGRAIPR